MPTTKTLNMPDIRGQIARSNDLLALPDAVLEILESVGKDDVSFDALADIIRRDPALTGRLLKIANSSFYGLTHRVNSIHQAIMVMGVTTVKCLALSASLFNAGRLQNDLEIDINALYGNFVTTAMTCRKLAVACEYPAPEDAFTCGLLLDIGLLYFLDHYLNEYRDVIRNARQSGSLLQAEKQEFGITHEEVGQLIAQKWSLPEHLASAIGNHHIHGKQAHKSLDEIVRLAVVLGRDVIMDDDNPDYEEKITKITFMAKRLGVNEQQLGDISGAIIRDSLSFAKTIDIEVEDFEVILSRANKEIFCTYMSLQRLFQERQELTSRLLNEERERGILEAKQVATSTLAHYINNAAMEISGHSQILRMSLNTKDSDAIAAMLPRELDVFDIAVRKIVAVIEELSEVNMLDDLEFFDKSRILNIDEKIKARLANIDQPIRRSK